MSLLLGYSLGLFPQKCWVYNAQTFVESFLRPDSSGFLWRGDLGGHGDTVTFESERLEGFVCAACAAPAVWKPGPTMAEIEETVRDTALSLIGVESLDNDEPLMDAGTLDHEFSRKKHQ